MSTRLMKKRPEKQMREENSCRVPTKAGHEWNVPLLLPGLSNTSVVKSHTLQGIASKRHFFGKRS